MIKVTDRSGGRREERRGTGREGGEPRINYGEQTREPALSIGNEEMNGEWD